MLKRDLNGKCLHWMRNKRRTIAVTAAANWKQKNQTAVETQNAQHAKKSEQ